MFIALSNYNVEIFLIYSGVIFLQFSLYRVIHDHQVNAILTAPTALRVIRRSDPEVKIGRKYSTKS